jgi:alpha-L-rhamnosidase
MNEFFDTPDSTEKEWSASWIIHPEADHFSYGIYHYRKTFQQVVIPAAFIINISADNHYRLYINGISVLDGPAKGDAQHWFYDTLDISQYLIVGKNILAAVVWNMGQYSSVSQISLGTGFFVEGDSQNTVSITTDKSWKVAISKAYLPCALHTSQRLNVYMAIGPGENVDFNLYLWGWETEIFDDSGWLYAITPTKDLNLSASRCTRKLAQRNIPLLQQSIAKDYIVRRINGEIAYGYNSDEKVPYHIPPYTRYLILLDCTNNTVAYPQLTISNGKSATIKIIYAESLFSSTGDKGNRNDIDGKQIYGMYDLITSDGGQMRTFKPLTFRCYRYVQLEITTYDESLIIQEFASIKLSYPLKLNATFSSNDQALDKIWQTGWHTLQLCAGEMYYDTPYYEQLQYIGDSRIQSLITLYLNGDERLMKKAILDFANSQIECGLTQSRYPSKKLQVIPVFSLFWINMVVDIWMHRDENIFVQQFLPIISDILKWFEEHIDHSNNMLGPLPYWNFVDWDNFDERGTAPGAETGNSSIITLQFSATLLEAVMLFNTFGLNEQANHYNTLAHKLAQHTFRLCFNVRTGLIADTPEQRSYSQHAGIWAILSGCIPQHRMPSMIDKMLNTKGIAQVTYFYRFYLTRALKKSGMADLYYGQLDPWHEMLKLGLTTFAEKPEPTRSDCHAWSASPNYEMLATICGIVPGSPNFKKIIIEPALGGLTNVEGEMPHPNGIISVTLNLRAPRGISAEICLPEQTSGSFIWNQVIYPLQAGQQTINV